MELEFFQFVRHTFQPGADFFESAQFDSGKTEWAVHGSVPKFRKPEAFVGDDVLSKVMEQVGGVIQVVQRFLRLLGKVFRPIQRYCGGSVYSVQVLFVDCIQLFHVFPPCDCVPLPFGMYIYHSKGL